VVDPGPDPLFTIPGSVTPIGVNMRSARDRVGEGNGYVDLRLMGDANRDGVLDASEEAALPSDPAPLALRVELIVTDEQYSYILQYRSTAFSPDDENFDPSLVDTDLLAVTRVSATQWTIENQNGARALLTRRLGWNEQHEIGIFEVPISLTITQQP
jgi:hypothetical protein